MSVSEGAVRRLVEAVLNQGPQPEYHRRVMRRHREEWPTLWNAINQILREYKKGEEIQ